MEFRPAIIGDFEKLKSVYREIIKNMEEVGVRVWDEVYPGEFFEADINAGRLYVLTDGAELISAFALCDTNSGETAVSWENTRAKALYLERFAVNFDYSNKGMGSLMLINAMAVAREAGAEYLRLFVAEINSPAIAFYEKNGFTRADGVFYERFEDGSALCEFGYEKKC